MTDQNSIFGDNTSQATPAATNNGMGSNPSNPSSPDPITTMLGSIKNEKGEQKYKSLEDALTALRHSQEYIPQLTTQLSQKDMELTAARAEASRIKELEDSVRQLTQSNASPVTTPQASYSEEQIAEIVSRTLSRDKQVTTQQANVSTVVSLMKETFGDQAEATFNRRAEELGMQVQDLNRLAASNPKAVLELIGVKKSIPSSNAPTQSSVNSGAFAPTQQSFIGRNKVPTLIGATSQDLLGESRAARQMVDELHAQGKSVHDLTDPKVYAAMFIK